MPSIRYRFSRHSKRSKTWTMYKTFTRTSRFQTKRWLRSKRHNLRKGDPRVALLFIMTLALGIDPGTATTGFGLVRIEPDESLVAVKYGVILTPKEATASSRLGMLYDDLQALLKEYKPELAAVEKLFFSRNVTTAIAVGQARGVVMLCLHQAGLEPFEYTP